MTSSPSFALRPVTSPSLSPTMRPSQTSSEGSTATISAGDSSHTSIFGGEEEPRGTKVSERAGWVTVIVNRKRGQLEVPIEEYEEWLDAVTKDDAPRRKKILNKWGGRRRTMDRRDAGYKPPAGDAEHSTCSTSPPSAAASLPPIDGTRSRRPSASTPSLPSISSSIGPLPPIRSPTSSPYLSSFKRPRSYYEHQSASEYSDPCCSKRPRSTFELPPLPFDIDRARHDRYHYHEGISAHSHHHRPTWDELKARYDKQVCMLERDGLALEIASAQYRKCEIDYLNHDAELKDAEVMYAKIDMNPRHSDKYYDEEAGHWHREIDRRRAKRNASHEALTRATAELDLAARACTTGRREIERTGDSMMAILSVLRPSPPRPHASLHGH